MLLYLFLVLTLVPIVELWMLLQYNSLLTVVFGPTLAVLFTILTVIGISATGAWLARQQGLKAITAVQESLARGEMPTDAIIDGLFILVGGLFLLTPGFITDVIGLTFLFAPTRAWYRARAREWVQRQFAEGRVFVRASGINVFSSGFGFQSSTGHPNLRRIDPDEKREP